MNDNKHNTINTNNHNNNNDSHSINNNTNNNKHIININININIMHNTQADLHPGVSPRRELYPHLAGLLLGLNLQDVAPTAEPEAWFSETMVLCSGTPSRGTLSWLPDRGSDPPQGHSTAATASNSAERCCGEGFGSFPKSARHIW